MSVRDQMKADLRRAMKERDKATMTTLRSLLAAIDNAEAIPTQQDGPADLTFDKVDDVARKLLTEADIQAILQKEHAERLAAMTNYEELGRSDIVAQLRVEVELIARYL